MSRCQTFLKKFPCGSVPEQHCGDQSSTGRSFFTCPNFCCCPKGGATCTRVAASGLAYGNRELLLMAMQSLANNARHYCRKGHVRDAKDLKVTLFYHESSHNILTLSNIQQLQSEWVVMLWSKPYKCFIHETLLRGQANPSCSKQLVRWEKKPGQRHTLYSVLPAPNIQVSSPEVMLWCEQLSSFPVPCASSLGACVCNSNKTKYISSNILCMCIHIYLYTCIHMHVVALQLNSLYFSAPLATLMMKQSTQCIVNQAVITRC